MCACLPTLPKLVRSRQKKRKDGSIESSSGESKFFLLRAVQSRLRSGKSSQGSRYIDIEDNGLHKKASHNGERTGDVIGLQPVKDSKIIRETPREQYERRQARDEDALWT